MGIAFKTAEEMVEATLVGLMCAKEAKQNYKRTLMTCTQKGNMGHVVSQLSLFFFFFLPLYFIFYLFSLFPLCSFAYFYVFAFYH